jgi:hypothetical protein
VEPELESLVVLVDSLVPPLESLESFEVLLPSPEEDDDDDALEPLADDDEERESVMYQPLPLKTMPTG